MLKFEKKSVAKSLMYYSLRWEPEKQNSGLLDIGNNYVKVCLVSDASYHERCYVLSCGLPIMDIIVV